jgi:endonuclease/exonuclease/phosphatase family metal-dependent hydrolase
VRVTSPSGDVDVFNTHLHANYCHDYQPPPLRVQRLAGQEGSWAGANQPTDEQAPLRIGQLLELTEVVSLVAASGQTPIVLAGDLNAVPDSLEADLLRLRLPQLHDCWVVADKRLTNSSSSSSSGSSSKKGSEEINPEGLTCKAPGNTFQPRRQVPERIDYVWSSAPCRQAQLLLQMSPAGCSYSDHFAVEATLELAPRPVPSADAAASAAGSGAVPAGGKAASSGPMQLGGSRASAAKSPRPGSVTAAAGSSTLSFDRQTATAVACASLLEEGIQSFAGSHSAMLALSGALLVSLVYACIGVPLLFPELSLSGLTLTFTGVALVALSVMAVSGVLMAHIGDRSQKRALQNAYRQLHVFMVESGLRLVPPPTAAAAAAANAPTAASG